jgi:two-component system sensor histidine kinase/response regulator
MCDEEKSKSDLVAELAALRQRVKDLETFNADLEAYVHIVAHDLKHPLGLIVGYAEFLLEVYEGTIDEELRRDLGVIAQRGRTMVDIIEEMLALVYVRGAEELSLLPLDMGSIVTKAQQRMDDVIKDLGAEIIAPDVWPSALGRDFLLEEVWVNLLGYALRYDGEKRQFRVKLGAQVLDDGQVRFWIQDNARALSAEEREALVMSMPQFRKVKMRSKHLGLPIVRYIIEKLGGKVGIVPFTDAGRGNEIFFTLPAA